MYLPPPTTSDRIYLLPTQEDQATFIRLFQAAIDHQDSLNSLIHPQWREQNYSWQTAINAEFGEILERYQGWKWWKKSKPFSEWSAEEKFQLALEFIDILHFTISEMLETIHNYTGAKFDPEKSAKSLASKFYYEKDAEATLNNFCYISPDRINIQAVFMACAAIFQYSPIQTLQLYFAKNALNQFRQEMQARPEGYEKVWACGREDNYYLQAAFNYCKQWEELEPKAFMDAIKIDLNFFL